VERQPGIMGEAVNKFDKLLPANTLENARKIVGFRYRLIWVIFEKHLFPLKNEILEK
jgi:hypothetical protein